MKRLGIAVAVLLLVSACRDSGISTESNPVPELVAEILPPGYQYVADYKTTIGGDSVWVVEVTEPEEQMPVNLFGDFFAEFAGTVDTTDVAWLQLSVIGSEAWMPYAYCIRSGPARAANRGEITDSDVFKQLDACY